MSSITLGCLTDEVVAAWTVGELDEEERRAALDHAEGCGRCAALLGAVLDPGASSTPTSLGRYQLMGPLGAGGMGVVFRAHDPLLGREVAVKMMHAALDQARHRTRMLREAQALAKLSHPNVVTVYDCGEAGDEVYVAMELVAGQVLQRWLADVPRSLEARLEVVLQIGRGLTAVHAAGTVHRDLKPDNVIVRADGSAVLIDFGLAHGDPLDRAASGPTPGGTPRYLAPEVAAGGRASFASDEYQWWTLVEEVLGEDRRIAAVVTRGRRAEPQARFGSMRAAVQALEGAFVRRARKRWPWAVGLGLAVLGLGLGASRLRRDPCPGAARVGQGYTPERRARVEAALRAAGADVPKVLAALDTRARATERLLVESCRSPGDAAALRHEICLRETWREAEQDLAALVDATPAQVRRTVDELIFILPVERCVHGALLGAAAAPPAKLAPRIAALEDQLWRLRLRGQRGAREQLAEVDGLSAEVEAIGDARLRARWSLDRAALLQLTGDLVGAATALKLAAHQAEIAGDDDLRARTLVQRLFTAYAAGEQDTEAIAAEAEAVVERLGSPALRVDLQRAEAQLDVARGDAAAARARLEPALASLDAISIDAHAPTVKLLQALGGSLQMLGELDRAQAYYDRGYAVARRRFGEDAPETLVIRGARATNILYRQDLAQAEPELRAVADGIARTQGPSPSLMNARGYLCELSIDRDPAGRAKTDCAAAISVGTAVFGADSPQLIWPLDLEGQRLITIGQPGLAVPILERALALAERATITDRDRPSVEAFLAVALARSGQRARAQVLARKVAPVLGTLASFDEVREKFARDFPTLAAAWPAPRR